MHNKSTFFFSLQFLMTLATSHALQTLMFLIYVLSLCYDYGVGRQCSCLWRLLEVVRRRLPGILLGSMGSAGGAGEQEPPGTEVSA